MLRYAGVRNGLRAGDWTETACSALAVTAPSWVCEEILSASQAIDSATRDQIQGTMRRFSSEKTTFIITHRLCEVR